MAQCFHPFFVDAPSGSNHDKHPVPCGKCPPCLQRRASAWSFRLLNEMDSIPRCFFLTLTYSSPPLSKSGRMTLVKRDWVLFMKRLRKFHVPGTTIRYYAVGEYGSKRMRPHFHAIIYGVNPEHISKAWSPSNGTKFAGVPGLFECDPDVNPSNIAYVCKYITKGRLIPQYAGDDRVPEFSLMSKHLGECYLTPQMIRYHKADLSRTYHVLDGGVKVAMSRYYKDKIFSPEEREFMFFQNQDDFALRFKKEMDSYIAKRGEARYYLDKYESQKAIEKSFFRSALIAREDL